MARSVNRLDSKAVEHAKPKRDDGKPTLLPDGRNLYLQVSAARDGGVNRSWLFRYEFAGVRHDMGLGPLADVGLAKARAEAAEYRDQIRKGIDPLAVKRERVAEAKRTAFAAKAEKAKAVTFERCVEMYLKAHSKKWTHPKHAQQWANTLKTACDVLGELAVSDITTPHIIKTLEPIWHKTPETASRLRGRIESVLGFATVSGFRTGDNPARWRGHLREVLPARSEIQKVELASEIRVSEARPLGSCG